MTTTTTRAKIAAALAAAMMTGGVAVATVPLEAQAAPATTSSVAAAATTSTVAAKPRNATLATALSGRIPCSIGSPYDLGCGRMKNGRLKLNRDVSPYAHIEIKDIDYGGRRSSVRFVDVAGGPQKEAVVLISANAGGVSWPNFVTVYDGNGALLSTWSSAAAIQKGRKGGASGARESTSFSRTRATSVDLRVTNIATGTQCVACGTGVDVYRLSKGKNGKPVFRLITRR